MQQLTNLWVRRKENEYNSLEQKVIMARYCGVTKLEDPVRNRPLRVVESYVPHFVQVRVYMCFYRSQKR